MRNILHGLTFTLLLFVCAPASVKAHDEGKSHSHAPTALGAAEIYEPSAMPDRIILSLSSKPRTTQSVNWRTSVEVTRGLAEIAEAEAGPYFSEKSTQFVSKVEKLETDLSTAHYHSVTFNNLKPGTTYAYRVGDGNNWSEWFHFRTATEEDSPFSFVYFGDAQNSVRSLWSRVIREAHRDAPKAAFLLHAGDLVNRAESDGEWGEWFGAGAWLNAMTPSIAIPGNHEQAKIPDGSRKLSHHWRPTFTFPENGPKGLEETCYTLTYHNLRVIGLDSNRMQAEQAQWLEGVLAANTSQWVVCTFHHPIYSTGKGRDNPEIRQLWKPIFDKYKVDLVLQGHDHTYGRTGFEVPAVNEEPCKKAGDGAPNAEVGEANLPTGLQTRDETTGTVYVVSVSGPKMYNNTRFEFMKRVAEDTQLYQVVHINEATLRFEARTAIGQLYDAFELHKQEESINKLVELEPEVPQNLRPLQEAITN